MEIGGFLKSKEGSLLFVENRYLAADSQIIA
jgi:hypothetical protein